MLDRFVVLPSPVFRCIFYMNLNCPIHSPVLVYFYPQSSKIVLNMAIFSNRKILKAYPSLLPSPLQWNPTPLTLIWNLEWISNIQCFCCIIYHIFLLKAFKIIFFIHLWAELVAIQPSPMLFFNFDTELETSYPLQIKTVLESL